MSRAFKMAARLALALFCLSPGALADPTSPHQPTSTPQPTSPPQATVKPAPPSREDKLDVVSPLGRDNRRGAYSLARGVSEIEIGMLGLSGQDLYGQLGFRHGVGAGVQIGFNLLHVSAGLFNISAKWTIIERKHFAIATSFSPGYAHGEWLWLFNDNEAVGNVDVFLLPFVASASFFPLPWLQFDLDTEFRDVEIIGDANEQSLVFDAALAARSFALLPGVRVHLKKRVSLFFSTRLPLWTEVPASIEAEVEVEPGVVVGGRVSGTKNYSLSELYSLEWGARASLAPGMYATFALNYGTLAKRLYSTPLSPTIRLEFRF